MALQRHMRIVDDGNTTEAAIGIKFAFATTDMKFVNQHFGSAESFALYMVDPEKATLIEAAQFGTQLQDGNEDKLASKMQMLDGCAAVYCQAIGASAIRQLVAKGVQPIKVAENVSIEGLIEALQDEMRLGPSAWLAKAIQQQKGPDMSRFDEMDDEGWDE